MLWIVLILLLALAGGFLGALLEFALWAVLLVVVGILAAGVLAWRAVTARTGAGGGRRRP
ncbi:hypothetical protein [Trujillonella humicola]|uniref:hypothetical protein n=1 Tax=Trujillonella humicola TaxID=3383699 RepID=UPI003905807F